jgi:uncharacterized protein
VLRVTCDTNIYISGLNFPGNPRRILKLAEAGAFLLAITQAILDEISIVLRRDKFGWPEEEVQRALHLISHSTERVEPLQQIEVITEDPSDNRILECAVASRSET